jgi:Cyclin, N-terminal domain
MLLEGIAAACLLIASKFKETKPPRLSELLQCVKLSETPHLVLNVERVIFRDVLQWRMSILYPFKALEMIIGYWNSTDIYGSSSPA